ncbi:MAG: porin, partial [Rhodobacteraceae bacterium]|nr:porin [Paracoccaceae bacterium]
TVSIEGPFGKLKMGKNDSAAKALVGSVSGVGYSYTMSQNKLGYLGADDAPNALYTYTIGDLSVSASIGSPRNAKSAAVKYGTDVYSVAIGYENNLLKDPADKDPKDGQTYKNKPDSQVSFGGSVSVAGAELKVVAVDDLDASKIGYAASVDYSVSDVGLTVFGTSNKSFGLGGAYDLGDGVEFKTGAVKSKDQKLVYDAGVTFSF